VAAVATLGLSVVGVTMIGGDDRADSLTVAGPSGTTRTVDPRADRDQRQTPTPSATAASPAPRPPAPPASAPAPPKPSAPATSARPRTTPPAPPKTVPRAPTTTPPPAPAPAPATCGASFYDQGDTTASGEPFDPNGMTAAHKTFAFNTMLKVTNTANGKSVTVRINDRGPFVEDRCLDLARGAFERIASVSTGVITVRFEVL
jgi:rare lipoprotein A